MSGERVSTLNAPDDSSSSEQTLSDDGAPSTPLVSGDGLISTTEFETVQEKPGESGAEAKPKEGEADEEGAAKPAADEKPAGDQEGGDKEPKTVPYDRFKEKVDREKTLTDELSRANQLIADLKAGKGGNQETQQQQQEKVNFIDMSEKTDDELSDWFDDSPREFMGNLARQVVHEAIQGVMNHLGTIGHKSAIQKNVGDFASNNEGFEDMKSSGQLASFIKSNPGHNEFSAYYALTEQSRKAAEQERIDKAVAEAVKKAGTEFTNHQKAKQTLRPVGGGAAPVHQRGNENELTDTKSSGGLVSVLTRRLVRSRERAAQ